ncbi:DUF1304 domain-containing protein [Humidisolicoccus flavus]|uniref:DUF1304 domain-containing protein n=1 Tax=Humidisolicoccus flavus TaxID=3111414 RepID=UPI0032529C75
MLIAALIFAGLASVLHVYIFALESLLWTSDRARKTFGIKSAEEAQTTKSLAYNQGFYNLFLALMGFIGIALIASGHLAVGATLVYAGVGSMLLAALVLVTANAKMARAALLQGGMPLLSVALLTVALVSANA